MDGSQFKLPPNPAKTPRPVVKPTFTLCRPSRATSSRTVLYGTSGVGKTTLAAHIPGKTAFIDLDNSIPVLLPKLTSQGVADSLVVVNKIETWDNMMDALAAPIYADVNNVVIDTVTRAQELAAAWVPLNIKGDKGQTYTTIEDYPYGQGPGHLYEVFLRFFQACDNLARQGKNVVLICHESTSMAPNPEGVEFMQYSPNLSHPKSGKGSIKLKVKDWADHVLFIQNGKIVDKDGKARDTNQRMVYPVDQAWAMAKSRVFDEPFLLEGFGEEMWKRIVG